MLQRSLDRAHARRSDEGFTLIELLIVIIILGVLAAIVVFSVTGIKDKGDKAACQAEISTVDTAFEANVAQGGSKDPTTVSIGDLATAGLIHNPPASNKIDGNDFGSAVTVSAVDGYTCK